MARTTRGFRFVRTIDGGPPAMGYFYRDNSTATAFKEGNVLRVSQTSGSAAKLPAATATVCLGVCGADFVSSTSGTAMPVYLAVPNNVFEAKMVATSTPKYRLMDTLDIRVNTVYNYSLQGTSSVKHVRVVGYDPDDEGKSAATMIRYHVVFFPDRSAYGRAGGASGGG